MLTDQRLEEKTVTIVTANDCIIFMMYLKTISIKKFEGTIIRVKKTNHLQVDLFHIDLASLLPESLKLKLERPEEPYHCSLVFGQV